MGVFEVHPLATQLANAWQSVMQLSSPDRSEAPADQAQAYDVQHALFAVQGWSLGGWKVGAKDVAGPAQCAPLPVCGILSSPAVLPRAGFGQVGLEVEIGFRLGREFAPCQRGYNDDDVLSSIAEVVTTIEVVSSRYLDWPHTDKLIQLADLQNHGALVVGDAVRYDATMSCVDVEATLTADGSKVSPPKVGNPAGDPRRLLPWLVNHACARGLTVTPQQVITTGSYTGMYFVRAGGRFVAEIKGLPAITLDLLA